MGDCNSTKADEIRETYKDNEAFDIPKNIKKPKCKYFEVEADEYVSYHCNHPKSKEGFCLFEKCKLK
ncbi:hypothetical protein LCGC14_2782920 [marine sediment metagenome]|uniref:Uncharacterized protein n=1 Tax=marine sediment metagenome TaxID=412755 RepID=A0A0F9B1E1_9ZZZZ